MVGIKYDNGKPRAHLVLKDFARALEQVVAVGTFGAKKYSDSNWLQVEGWDNRYSDAMMRHLMEDLKSVGIRDDETGLQHLAHVAWNVLAILELRSRQGMGAEQVGLVSEGGGDFDLESGYGGTD